MRIFIDHKNLEYFTIMKILNKRKVWWIEELAEYNFVIIYYTEALNIKANFLSYRANYFLKEKEAMTAKPLLLHSKQ